MRKCYWKNKGDSLPGGYWVAPTCRRSPHYSGGWSSMKEERAVASLAGFVPLLPSYRRAPCDGYLMYVPTSEVKGFAARARRYWLSRWFCPAGTPG